MSISSSSSYYQLQPHSEEMEEGEQSQTQSQSHHDHHDLLPTTYEIEEQNNLDRTFFKIRYRSNSVVSHTSSTTELSTNVQLPTIKVLGTGGTIASKGTTSHQTAGYEVDLTIEQLIESIPDISTTCLLEYEQIFNIDSKEFDIRQLLQLYAKIVEDLNNYDGIVITHGTDTMEETAFFLQSTINTFKPIVICGSMRPSTAISSDGPMNLYQAIVIASSRESRGRGVLIALNDRIGSGYYITKSNANSLDTFKSIGQGYVGNFVNNEIHYYFPPAKPLGLTYFNITVNDPITDQLPQVPIIYAHQGLDNRIFKLTIEGLNAAGLVIATMGAGSLSDNTNTYLSELVSQTEFPIVYAKRSMDGMVPIGALPRVPIINEDYEINKGSIIFNNAIAGGYLNPQKARILLQLCLKQNMNLKEIKKVFKGV
ncbi:Asparaginase/glutaminase [Scheffersomyces amazonensis]|uniref:Asparaginase/glutaminase n=1 Tax=Scheffersomyces amazonensis TaxID=1078765 RepID=UPI00315CBD11